jgi:DNA-binding CsgD family transcriptional regulator
MTTTQRLRPVERRVLRLVEEGLDDAEIGRRFGRGERWTAQVRFLADLDVPRSHDGEADATDEAMDADAEPDSDEPTDHGGGSGTGADRRRTADQPNRAGSRAADEPNRAGSRAADQPTDDSDDSDSGDSGEGVAGVERLRPLERRLLRWRAQGVDHDELADRFRHSAEFLARVEEYARYKLAAAG